MLDLSTLKPAERVIEIEHPSGNGELLGIRVSLVSINDPKLERVKRKFLDERLRLEARGKHFKADDIEENERTIAFQAMTGWDWYGDIQHKGEKPDFNQRNVMEVCKEYPWFLRQVLEAVEDEKSFFTN